MKIWLAEQDTDAECYNVIAKTKKDLLEQLGENTPNPGDYYEGYRAYKEIFQIKVNVSDLFELLDRALGEGGGKNRWLGEVIEEYTLVEKGNGKLGLKRK